MKALQNGWQFSRHVFWIYFPPRAMPNPNCYWIMTGATVACSIHWQHWPSWSFVIWDSPPKFILNSNHAKSPLLSLWFISHYPNDLMLPYSVDNFETIWRYINISLFKLTIGLGDTSYKSFLVVWNYLFISTPTIKFGNRLVISSHIQLGMWLSTLGLKLKRVSKRGPRTRNHVSKFRLSIFSNTSSIFSQYSNWATWSPNRKVIQTLVSM